MNIPITIPTTEQQIKDLQENLNLVISEAAEARMENVRLKADLNKLGNSYHQVVERWSAVNDENEELRAEIGRLNKKETEND